MSTITVAAIEKFPDEYEAQLVGHHEISVVTIFNEFVSNKIPTHLIYIPQKRVISRAALSGIFKPEHITEAEIIEVMKSNGYTRIRAITAIVHRLLKYAILSHRWSHEGEPTYAALTSGATWAGPGYQKLQCFCEKAQKYGCTLAWSDTCCIDKSSSVELDEAIRSMFRWYRDAHACIVFLAGVSRLEDLHRDEWFRRGWTLQELLAPRFIKFYGSNWEALGRAVNDKEDDGILEVVSQTTAIPIQDLKTFVPGTNRVQEKMAWASKRRTTRVEDMAYSLIGLFDISMQIAYGEEDWAFHRLMEIILQRCDEWEIFAWAGPSSGHSSIAIPKSPRCYYPLDFSNFRDDAPPPDVSQRKKFSMTVQGLEIKLAVIRGEMNLKLDGTFSFNAKAQWNLPPPFTPIQGRTSWRDSGESLDWGIGLVNYRQAFGKNGEEIGVLVPQTEYLCFLLHARNDTLNWKTRSSNIPGWKKVSTSNILTTRASLASMETIPLITLWI